MDHKQICPPNCKYALCLQNVWRAFIEDVYPYMCHIWNHCLQACDQAGCTQKTMTPPTTPMSTAPYWSFMWKTSVMPYMKPSANKKSQIWMMGHWQGDQSCFTMCSLNLNFKILAEILVSHTGVVNHHSPCPGKILSLNFRWDTGQSWGVNHLSTCAVQILTLKFKARHWSKF